MSSLFISDLHLKPDAPQISSAARQLLLEFAPQFQNLFILGDLVEYWLGDDAYDGSLDSVFDAIRTLSERGTRVRVMFGNRDFLFANKFADGLGAKLIPDDVLLFEDEGHTLLLMHGDTLCTDDKPYQQLRCMLRDEQWQLNFLSQSIPVRIQAAMQLREASRQQTLEKSNEIMDVNQGAVEEVMREYGVFDMIHGHTHRPDIHFFQVETHSARRTVLGDWDAKGGKIVTLKNGQLNLQDWTVT